MSFSKCLRNKDGLQSWCKECVSSYVKENKDAYNARTAGWRARNPDRHMASAVKSVAKSRSKYPEKTRSRRAVSNAMRDGRLFKPDSCERCDSRPRGAHHADYSKPLDVDWLCRPCHGAEHGRRWLAVLGG